MLELGPMSQVSVTALQCMDDVHCVCMCVCMACMFVYICVSVCACVCACMTYAVHGVCTMRVCMAYTYVCICVCAYAHDVCAWPARVYVYAHMRMAYVCVRAYITYRSVHCLCACICGVYVAAWAVCVCVACM